MKTFFSTLRYRCTRSTRRLTGLLLGAGLFATAPAHAQQLVARPVRLTQREGATLDLRVNNPGLQPCRVRVWRGSTGETLFREASLRPVYGKQLLFEGLRAGRYRLLVQVGAIRHVYLVQVTDPDAITTISVRQQRPVLPRQVVAVKQVTAD
ncbi:hypothetical protein ACW9KT_19810 [Hymenobacter sp. HD11105]